MGLGATSSKRLLASCGGLPEAEKEKSMDELDSAKRLALLHDQIRREVTESLRWALSLFRTHPDMPKSELLAASFHEAECALRNSDRLTGGPKIC